MGKLMKVAPVSNICYLVFPAHLCPVGPRVLDSCSLIIRAIHIREAYGTPLSQSLIPSYFLGPQTSLRFYLLSCTYAMLLFYYDCARGTLYCLGKRNVFAVSTILVLGSRRLQPMTQTLSPSRSQLSPLRVYSMGWPPEIFLNLVLALS